MPCTDTHVGSTLAHIFIFFLNYYSEFTGISQIPSNKQQLSSAALNLWSRMTISNSKKISAAIVISKQAHGGGLRLLPG